jgi:hypothetical protein
MLFAKIGQREQARTELSTAIALYRSMDMIFWLPQAEATLAQVSGTDVSAGDSGSYSARAPENG